MKLIGLMSLDVYKDEVRKIFERHEVQIYSEIEIFGHTVETIKQYGWWPSEKEVPLYSTLFFAVIPADKAESIMNDISCFSEDCDPQHPPRAFQINVEQMV